VIYEHREPWWNDVDIDKFLTHLPELSGNPISRDIWYKEGEMGEGY
jgi:hypothetical protein